MGNRLSEQLMQSSTVCIRQKNKKQMQKEILSQLKIFKPVEQSERPHHSIFCTHLQWVEHQNLSQIPGNPKLVKNYCKYTTLTKPEPTFNNTVRQSSSSLQKQSGSSRQKKEHYKIKIQEVANNTIKNYQTNLSDNQGKNKSFLYQSIQGQLYIFQWKNHVKNNLRVENFVNSQAFSLRKKIYCKQLVSILDFSLQQIKQNTKQYQKELKTKSIDIFSKQARKNQKFINFCQQYREKENFSIACKVITQRVSYRLFELSKLHKFSFQQITFVIIQILEANSFLQKINVYSLCTIQKIGLTKKGDIKFWINKVFGKTQIQQSVSQKDGLRNFRILMSIFQTMLLIIQPEQAEKLAIIFPQFQIQYPNTFKTGLRGQNFQQIKQQNFFKFIKDLINKDQSSNAKKGQQKLIQRIKNFDKSIEKEQQTSIRKEYTQQKTKYKINMIKQLPLTKRHCQYIRIYISKQSQKHQTCLKFLKFSLSKTKRQTSKAISLTSRKKQCDQNIVPETKKNNISPNAKNINNLKSVRMQKSIVNALQKIQINSQSRQIDLKNLGILQNQIFNKRVDIVKKPVIIQNSLCKHENIQKNNIYCKDNVQYCLNKLDAIKPKQQIKQQSSTYECQRQRSQQNGQRIIVKDKQIQQESIKILRASFWQTPNSRDMSSYSSNIYNKIDSQHSNKYVTIGKSKVESTFNGYNDKSYINSLTNPTNSMLLRSSFNFNGSSSAFSMNLGNNVLKKYFNTLDSKIQSINPSSSQNFINLTENALMADKICESKNEIRDQQQEQASNYIQKRMKTDQNTNNRIEKYIYNNQTQQNQGKRNLNKQNFLSSISLHENKPYIFSESQIEVQNNQKPRTMQPNAHNRFPMKIQNLSSRKSFTISVFDEQQSSDRESIIIVSAKKMNISHENSPKIQTPQKSNSLTEQYQQKTQKGQIDSQQNCFNHNEIINNNSQDYERYYLLKNQHQYKIVPLKTEWSNKKQLTLKTDKLS